MSLAAPEETSLEAAFVCNESESVLSAIEKCLDNGLGTCLVVGDDHRLLGRISLDDITAGLADGTRDRRSQPGRHPGGPHDRRPTPCVTTLDRTGKPAGRCSMPTAA